jgi:energy-coupling factor transporter transmembrane protein EcfT
MSTYIGRAGAFRLGIAGQLVCLAFSLAVLMLAQGWRVAVACGLVLALAAAFYPAGLRPLTSPRIWIFMVFLLVPAAMLLGTNDTSVGGFGFSSQGVEAGIQMVLRAVGVLTAVSGFAASVSVSELSALLERAGLRGLGFALGVAVNMLPTIQETVVNAYQALRLRGGFRRERLQALKFLLVTVIVNALRHADDIVCAAEARAFSAERAWRQPIEWHWGDVALAVVLLPASLVLLLA